MPWNDAAVEREGEQHHVAGDRAGHGDADQQRAILAPRHVARPRPRGRGGAGSRASRGSARPRDSGVRCRVPRSRVASERPMSSRTSATPGHHHAAASPPATRRPRSGRPRGRARRSPARRQPHGSRAVKGRVVELARSRLAGDRGAACSGAVDALPDLVVAVEPVAADHLVRHPATRAAELELGARLDQAGGHGEGAVITVDGHGRDCLMRQIRNSEVGIRNAARPASPSAPPWQAQPRLPGGREFKIEN